MAHLHALDVASHVAQQATALALLTSTPQRSPHARHAHLGLSTEHHFTYPDVEYLLSVRRTDLAALVVASSSDINLLYAVSRTKTTTPILAALCSNPHTPTDLLLFLYRDTRKGVVAAARTTLGKRLHPSKVDRYADCLTDLAFGPEENIPRHLNTILRDAPGGVIDAALELLLERPGAVNDTTWDMISAHQWAHVTLYTPDTLIRRLVTHPRATVADLEILLTRLRYALGSLWVAEALLDRLTAGSPRWFDMLALCSAWGRSTNVSAHATALTAQQATDLFRRGIREAKVAIASGHLPDAELLDAVTRWATHHGGLDYVPLPALASPLVDGDLLHRCINQAARTTPALNYLAQNPNVPEHTKLAWLAGGQIDVDSLVEDPLSAELSEQIGHLLHKHVADSRHGQPLRWLTKMGMVALLASAHVPAHVRLAVPVDTLTWLAERPSTDTCLRDVIRFLDAHLGGGPEEWQMFLRLLPEWEGSIGDLVHAATAL